MTMTKRVRQLVCAATGRDAGTNLTDLDPRWRVILDQIEQVSLGRTDMVVDHAHSDPDLVRAAQSLARLQSLMVTAKVKAHEHGVMQNMLDFVLKAIGRQSSGQFRRSA